jgi:hypothetical protein
MALGSTQSLVKMSNRDVPGGKGGRCMRLTTYYNIVPMSRNLGALTLPDPSGPAWPVMDVLYLYLLQRHYWATVSVIAYWQWITKWKIWASTCWKDAGSTTKPVYLVLAQNTKETVAIQCWLIVHSDSQCSYHTDKRNNALQNSFKLWYLNFRYVSFQATAPTSVHEYW